MDLPKWWRGKIAVRALGTAERLVHNLIWPGWVGVSGERRGQILVGPGEYRDEFTERHEIPIVHGRRDCFLDEMIARDDRGIGGAHHRYALVGGHRAVVSQPTTPLPGPAIVGGRISEEAADAGVVIRAGSSFA
jgi:hypothetical protein